MRAKIAKLYFGCQNQGFENKFEAGDLQARKLNDFDILY
jgi:hypothetical protein